VQCPPVSLDDEARLGFLAYCIDAGNFFTGPDMGFPPELADVLRARFTRNIVGGKGGALGPTGTPTARGCVAAMREVGRASWGSEDLRGRTVAIQGLGAVGLPLARLLKEIGAKVVVADRDPSRLAQAREALGELEVVSSETILQTPCDVLAPCALGGVLDAETIERLRCAALCGSANNQLKAVSQGEELALAERVRGRGILYPPEWTHNIAGVVAGFEEYVHGEEARMDRIDAHVERVCRAGIRQQLEEARATGRTPTAVAYAKVERLIYPER
jgi:glutamate dehydrogenase/leucine dehydrogenase